MRISMQNGTDIPYDSLTWNQSKSAVSAHRKVEQSKNSVNRRNSDSRSFRKIIYPLIRKIFVQIPHGASTNQKTFQPDVSASELIRR